MTSETGSIPVARCSCMASVIALVEAAGLPTVDLTEEHCEHFFVAGDPNQPAGAVGLEIEPPYALLRSVVVRDGSRTRGIGSVLVARAEAHARACGASEIYLLTTTAAPFFAARGYAHVPREAAPPFIRSTREFASLCPASSAFMFKSLEENRS